MGALDPIHLGVDLACPADRAFAVYTGRIGEWWHPRYTRDAGTLEAITIEPFVGGRVFATHRDGVDVWGEVRVWQPGRRVTHSFSLAQDPAHPSEVSVTFTPATGGCRLDFDHGGWTAANVAARSKFGDWAVMLERMVELAHEEEPRR